MGDAKLVLVSATRGIRSPLSVDLISSIAEASGELPSLLIPTFCAYICIFNSNVELMINTKFVNFLIVLTFLLFNVQNYVIF